MIEEPVEIRTADGTTEGVLFRPDGPGPCPGVLHLTDIRGVRAASLEMARRVAGEGYTVLIPNVFYRTGKPPFALAPGVADEQSKRVFADLTRPMTPEAVESDAAAYVDFLTAQPAVSTGPMGVIGYCFTGAVALRIAAARPDRIGAAASFHGGGLYTDAPTSPHLVLPRVKARLYFGHAEGDGSMPKDAIENLNQALAAWGGRFESEVYAGAGHGWTVPDHPKYDKPQAERAYARLTDLFSSALR